MDITVVDFFRSKYVLNLPDIIHVLDVEVINNVKKLRNIANIVDLDERKHQEALMVWNLMPKHTKDYFTHQFKIWIGDDIKDLATNLMDMKIRDIKHVHVKNKNTRKMTTPIHEHQGIKLLLKHVTPEEIKNNTQYDIYRLIFERGSLAGAFRRIWNYTDKVLTLYDHPSKQQSIEIKNLFFDIPYSTLTQFSDEYLTAIIAMHNVLMYSGIYGDYPTFHDYRNISAHIILMGKDYCLQILSDPNQVRPLIEYGDYYQTWDMYQSTTRH
jgi:hypothetical protein